MVCAGTAARPPRQHASGWETDYWSALPADVTPLAHDKSGPGAVIASYDTTKGGFVLGVGSVTFVGSLMTDSVLQQIVNSALAGATRPRPPTGVLLAWKGEGADPRLFYNSSPDGAQWSEQVQVGSVSAAVDSDGASAEILLGLELVHLGRGVCGVRKVHAQLARRAGSTADRCPVDRSNVCASRLCLPVRNREASVIDP
jgi:hypothetical protein